MTQALYRTWRSQTFEEVVGQDHVTRTLRNALRDERVAHAYLFSGPRGTGKTSTARILAKALNCTADDGERPCNHCPTCIAINEGRMLDLIEIDAASNNSVDDIRELREKVGFRPSEGQYKIYIIDEVHMLSTSAFNALLKTLEEPPPHTRFILATTEPHKIPATVLSRCQRFDFRRIPVPEISEHLEKIVQAEKFQAESDALVAIAQSAQGCMRDAISLLDQMFSYGGEVVTLAQVQQVLGAVSAETVSEFVGAVSAKNVKAGLELIQLLVLEGASLTEFAHQVVDYLRGVMLLQMTKDTSLLSDRPAETVQQMQSQMQQMALPETLFAINRFCEAIQESRGGSQPQLPLELALVEVIQGASAIAPPTPAVRISETTPVAAPALVQPVDLPASDTKPVAVMPGPAGAASGELPLDGAAVERLRHEWKGFLAIVRERCGFQVQAAFNSVRDIAVSSEAVAFAFGANEFARDMVARPEIHREVSAILSGFFDRPMQLDCQAGDQATLQNVIGENVGEKTGDGPDPLVEYAITNLGAQVID